MTAPTGDSGSANLKGSNGKQRIATTGGDQPATTDGQWTSIGKSGVEVGAATAPSADTVKSASVKILSPAETSAAGLSGLVIRVERTDNPTGAGAIALRVPDKLLNQVYGADFAQRATWSQYDTATASKSAKATKVASAKDSSSSTTVVTPSVGKSAVLMSPAASSSSPTGTGDYSATPLSNSALWDVSAQTGDFSWSYPFRVPPAPAGPVPNLALSYSAQSVDGRTGSTNNQTSVVGEGWDISGGGYIQRAYVPCATDDGSGGPVTTSGDLCWKTDNAVVSFAGHAGALVRDATTGAWKMQIDDGSRVEHLVGAGAGCASNGTYDTDCWRITTTDGTQYYFGLNQLPGWSAGNPTTNSTWTVPVYGNDAGEPCHGSSFAASSCMQAWRWNLDYVVDVHGNAQALYYNAETNKYAQNHGSEVTYIRGGQLDHIDYGLRATSIYAANAATDRVNFTYSATGRCNDGSGANCSTATLNGTGSVPANPGSYPDVPFDKLCASTCPSNISPTFFTNAMLTTISTSVLKSGSYSQVDNWALGHSFPDPGDGTSAALWLTQITHTGTAGGSSITEPSTTFTGVTMQNRVWPIDGLAPLDKYRISSITTSTGAVISVNYSAQECTSSNISGIQAAPQSNSMRCYPQWWTPDVTPPQPARLDFFHKYVVTSVVADPRTGGGLDRAEQTQYSYTGSPAWRYDNSPLTPPGHRTWSIFAGYDTVEVRTGAADSPSTQKVIDYTYYRGLDGDRASASGGTKSVDVTGAPGVKDSLWFAGTIRSQVTKNGVGGATLSTVTTTPWASNVTADNGTVSARLAGTSDVRTDKPTSTGGVNTIDVATTNDPVTGKPTAVSTSSTGLPSTCVSTTYAPTNTASWIVGLVSQTTQIATDCAHLGSAAYPQNAMGTTKTSYDGAAWGAAPTLGDPTKVESATSYNGSTPVWATAALTSYDAMGRAVQATDALGNVSKTAYVPAANAAAGSGPTTSVTTTVPAPFNWTTTTTVDPAWGLEVGKVDPNGKSTTTTYDALGRRIGVWNSDHPQSTYPSQASVTYSYGLSNSAANWTSTATITGGGIITTYALYDGLGRPVQTQSPASGGGTTVTDTAYDTAGQVNLTNGSYWTPSVNPSGALFVPTAQSEIASSTQTTFDGAGRPTIVRLMSFGNERYRTTYNYLGSDRTDTTPPSGGTPTSSYTDSAGKQIKLVQYLASTIADATPSRATTYGYDASGNMTRMVDPVGNAWTWQFDLSGRTTSATDPDRGTTTTTYDLGGNVTSTTDARGTTLAYSYDALGRKTSERQGSTTGPLLSAWTYDTVQKGKPTSAIRYVGSTSSTPGLAYSSTVNSYDAGYRIASSTISIPTGAPAFGGTSYTAAYGYVGGSVATVVYPAIGGLPSERLRYGYDPTNAKPGAVLGLAQYGTAVYTAIGQLSQIQRTGPVTLFSNYGYDNATGATADITATTNSGSTYTQIRNSGYVYDNAGNVRSITSTSNTATSDTQCFTYDGFRNLTSAWTPNSTDCNAAPAASSLGGPAPYWNDYSVSTDTGNRLAVTHHATNGTTATEAYSYPAAGASQPHAVGSVASGTTTASYQYDATGATTMRPGQSLTYDAEGRLSTLTSSSGVQTNIYDATGALLLQVDPVQGASLYLGDTILKQAKGSSTVVGQRTYSIGATPVAERIASGAVTWLAADAQGTVSDQVDSATGVQSVIRRDPYGNPRTGSTASWGDGAGFLNAQVNGTSGLTQLGVRQYDPALGRFTSVDPLMMPGQPQQNNGYGYAGNNPITYADPSGACIPELCGSHASPDYLGPAVHFASASPAKSAPVFRGARAAAKPQPNSWAPNWQDVAAIGVGILATVVIAAAIVGTAACAAVTAGVCLIAAAAIAGAAGGLITYGLSSGTKTAEGAGTSILTGAVGGVLGGVAGLVVSGVARAVVGKVAGAVASKAAPVIQAADTAASNVTSSAGASDTAGLGVIYRRIDTWGGKDYIGQSKSMARYLARQTEHQAGNPDRYIFQIVDRAPAGQQLSRYEEYYIRQGGGPTNLSNPDGGLANMRYQMIDPRYQAAGGDIP